MTKPTEWNFIDPWGAMHFVEEPTKEAALKAANEHYQSVLEEEGGLVSGETYSDTVDLVCVNAENGSEVLCVSDDVSFEYYHGDGKEHGLHGSDLI